MRRTSASSSGGSQRPSLTASSAAAISRSVMPRRRMVPAKLARVSFRIPEGERNDTLASLAGTMRRRGMTEREIAAALLAVNEGRCDPPLDEAEVRRIATSVARYDPTEIHHVHIP